MILVADVQADTRRHVSAYLDQSGFHAVAAASADDLFQTVRERPVRAVVLDAAMRGADGMDLCHDLRTRSSVPIIMVGADSSEVDRVIGLELGADDYLAKPYSTRELAARLRAVLRRGGGDRAIGLRRQTQAIFDGWTMDLARRELVSRSGCLVALTGAEFALLATFVAHPQTALGRSRLIELGGGAEAGASDRSVDVLVSRLRRKLDDPAGGVPIVTVRGAGYMFTASVTWR